jgi:hypothetical protein
VMPKPAPALLIRSTPPAQATPPTATLIALPTSVRAPPRLTALTVRGLAAHTQLHERLCALTSSSPVIAAVAQQAATMAHRLQLCLKIALRQPRKCVLVSPLMAPGPRVHQQEHARTQPRELESALSVVHVHRRPARGAATLAPRGCGIQLVASHAAILRSRLSQPASG